ncbi:MAG: AAA family ATPase [Psychrobacter sp.]|uniref:ATP-binding protein n=1 Tax=unclassified Psychrobacter TaxID=196806 RepID=UPI001788800E|nr:ATP-binding protein [Psychrobacter sp. FME13]MBE0443224.1 AAA family ATPase [Psychrobacter sp. FME13]
MQLILFIGIQGAGKSTFYQRQFFHSHLRLNKDMLNTNHRLQRLFEACLATKTQVVIDKTNATSAERADYIRAAKAANFTVIAYYFDCPFKDALVRNNNRTGKAKVPEVGVKGTAKKMQRPYFEEGFNKIFTVTVGHDSFRITENLENPVY